MNTSKLLLNNINFSPPQKIIPTWGCRYQCKFLMTNKCHSVTKSLSCLREQIEIVQKCYSWHILFNVLAFVPSCCFIYLHSSRRIALLHGQPKEKQLFLALYLLRSHTGQGSYCKTALKTETLSYRRQNRKYREDSSCLLSHRPG